ncbi:hypothetical protein [Actinomadura rugatobispora]|uniref:Mce-associated membrane protein n=1 Tax=Actinomadura rugatobispora TaxID=1994 RepID=A0ABW0ZS05_9ACTN|nr:hypothetical protein GCM10010200_028250 [Actinomadura rugatobispora]
MTGKTTKDVPEGAEGVDAVDTEDDSAAEVEERPATRRRRRVRVIEVLDDEDLDEVLDAIDAEEQEDDRPARPKPKAAAKPKPKVVEPEAEEETAEDEERSKPQPKPKAAPKPKPKAPVSLDEVAPRTFLGLRRNQAIVVVLLVAVLASLGVWQWRAASGLSGERDDRDAVSKVASAYGDVALNYNAGNYQAQMKKAEGLMGGDLLESFKTNTLPNLGNTFKQNPQLVLTSKTDQVFVGTVDQRFAAATISVDVTVKTSEGTHESPATLIRLAMAKIDGEWKVTKMYASGVNDQTQQSGGLPNVPTGPSPSSSPKSQETPKN